MRPQQTGPDEGGSLSSRRNDGVGKMGGNKTSSDGEDPGGGGMNKGSGDEVGIGSGSKG